jgi:siderophore synthetase component
MPVNYPEALVENVNHIIQSPPIVSPLSSDERRVVRQLLEALLFEKIVYFDVKKIDISNSIREKNNEIFNKKFSFSLGKYIFRAAGTISAFDRVRLLPESIQHYQVSAQQWRHASLNTIIHALDIHNRTKERLKKELTQTLDLCHWNTKHLHQYKTIRRSMDFQSLESAIIEGHLYHPCFKTRTGFTQNDHALYGPEAANTFQLLWLAVKSHTVDATLPHKDNIFWQQEIGADTYQQLTEGLLRLGANWNDYSLVPIHPWQYKSIAPLGLRQAMKQKEVLLLGKAGDFYQATQSLRTLINITHPLKANIKLPLNVICTSSHRNLQSHFVHTAPIISTWLQNQVMKDAYLQEKNNTLLLSEYAGLLYEPPIDNRLEGMIGVIFRESVLSKLEHGQSVVPFSALMLTESDDLPFINDWIHQHGLQAWLKQLLNTMLLPIWHLLAHQGIAFEAHSQNLLLIHRNGWPEKIVLRDFHEDTEFVTDFLQDPKDLPQLSSTDPYFKDIALDEGFAMESIEALRELFMDTVYVFNLADLAFLLERFYGFQDSEFWELLQTTLNEYAAAGITSDKRLQKINTHKKYIAVESLLKKKIMNGGALDYYEHSVSNPLFKTINTVKKL